MVGHTADSAMHPFTPPPPPPHTHTHTHTGVYLGDAYEVSPQLLGKAFYAAVVLKVRRLKVKFVRKYYFHVVCVCAECGDAVQLW